MSNTHARTHAHAHTQLHITTYTYFYFIRGTLEGIKEHREMESKNREMESKIEKSRTDNIKFSFNQICTPQMIVEL